VDCLAGLSCKLLVDDGANERVEGAARVARAMSDRPEAGDEPGQHGIACCNLGGSPPEAMHAPRSERSWEACLVEVDSIASHGDSFCEQERSLCFSLRDCSVGTDDAVPGQVVVGGEDASHEARASASMSP
jgi:hypothetical protein